MHDQSRLLPLEDVSLELEPDEPLVLLPLLPLPEVLLPEELLEELDEGECLLLPSRPSAGLRLGGDADLVGDCLLALQATSVFVGTFNASQLHQTRMSQPLQSQQRNELHVL